MTTRAPYRKRLQDHLRETKSHATAVSRRIKQLGGTAEEISVPGPGVVAEAAGGGASVVQQATAVVKGGMHAVRGTSEPEKMLKNAKTEAFNEEEEIANYTAIEALANTVGDKETARLARDIRRQEERMRGFLERLIPQLSQAVAKEEIPAQFRNGASNAGARRSSSRSTAARPKSKSSRSARSSSARSGSASARSGSTRSSGRSKSSRSTSGSRSAGSRSTAARSGGIVQRPRVECSRLALERPLVPFERLVGLPKPSGRRVPCRPVRSCARRPEVPPLGRRRSSCPDAIPLRLDCLKRIRGGGESSLEDSPARRGAAGQQHRAAGTPRAPGVRRTRPPCAAPAGASTRASRA